MLMTQEQRMSSREIAELTNKQHKNVLLDCDKLNDEYKELTLAAIAAGVYLHPNTGKQEHREYLLTRIQTLDLMTGYDIKLRIKVNRRWEELENRNVGLALPVAEIAEMKELLTKQSAELSEIKALLDQRIIRANRPTPRVESALSQQEKDQIAAFWDALNESKSVLLKKEHWTVDHEYLYISLPKMMPYYEPYCMRHELDFINAGDLKDVLLSGRYAPYVASTQKGTHNSHKKAGFGRCYRFRYEVRDRELFIGDKKITFARLQ